MTTDNTLSKNQINRIIADKDNWIEEGTFMVHTFYIEEEAKGVMSVFEKAAEGLPLIPVILGSTDEWKVKIPANLYDVVLENI